MLCVISGGNWNNTSNAGAFARNLNNNRTNSNNNVGLACDSDPSPDTQQCETGTEGDGFLPCGEIVVHQSFGSASEDRRRLIQ